MNKSIIIVESINVENEFEFLFKESESGEGFAYN